MSTLWCDSHCHLPESDDAGDVVARARGAGVERMITVGTDIESSVRAGRVGARFDGVWATAGVHPHEARHGLDGLADILDEGWAVAVGECGLDYHYDHSPRDVQADVFAAQIALAHETDLPLVIHTRDAWAETFAILDLEGVPSATVFHCFTGGPEQASAALERGCYLSFSGIVTFPSAGEVRAAAAMTPLDRLLVETDSPYLAPVPHRGRRNQPAHLPDVGAGVAQAAGLDPARVASAAWSNAAAVFGLD